MLKNLLMIVFFCLSFISPKGYCIINKVQLPKPKIYKTIYLEEAILRRRSLRDFDIKKSITVEQLSHLLWAAQGITNSMRNFRAAPSAGALYPLDLYVVKDDGVWRYFATKHELELVINKDLRRKLALAALGQMVINDAPLSVVIVAEYKRITRKYYQRGIQYAYMEAGHVAQNLLLEAVSLGLGGVPIGAFYRDKVSDLLQLSKGQDPIYIIPIGYKR